MQSLTLILKLTTSKTIETKNGSAVMFAEKRAFDFGTTLPKLLASGAVLVMLASCTTSPETSARSLQGTWSGTFTSTTRVGTNGIECTDGRGKFLINNNALRGSATNTYGQKYSLSGRVVGDERVEGRFELKNVTAGTFQGKLIDERLRGTFVDAEKCRGQWSATKA